MISCSADAISLTPHAHTQIKSFVFKYAAVARRDEGFVKRWCFACLDSGRMYPPAVQCITIRIRLCEVFVEEDESLGNVESTWDFQIATLTRIVNSDSITRKYHLDSNWRRLWNLNSDLGHGASKMGPYQLLRGDLTLRYVVYVSLHHCMRLSVSLVELAEDSPFV